MSAQHLGRKRHFWHRDCSCSLRSHFRLTERLSSVDHVYRQLPSGSVVQYLFSNMIPDRVWSIGFLRSLFSRCRLTKSPAAWRTGAEFSSAISAPVSRVRLQRLVKRLHHLLESPKDIAL